MNNGFFHQFNIERRKKKHRSVPIKSSCIEQFKSLDLKEFSKKKCERLKLRIHKQNIFILNIRVFLCYGKYTRQQQLITRGPTNREIVFKKRLKLFCCPSNCSATNFWRKSYRITVTVLLRQTFKLSRRLNQMTSVYVNLLVLWSVSLRIPHV